MPPALIFDVDGTLAETEELHRQAFNQTFAAAGLPWHWDRALYRRLLAVAGGKERLAAFVAAQAPERAGEVDIPALHAAKTARYTQMIAAGAVTLRPGIARLLAEARQAGVPVAIATTTSLPNVEALLRATLGEAGPGAFAVIGAGDVVPAKKPAPDIYAHVLRRLAIPASACIAFEDSTIGLAAARAAGIPTVVTPSLYTDEDDFTGALAVVSDLGDPQAPYRHLAGAGAGDGMVTIDTLARWSAAVEGRRSP
ncbi:Protein CbbY, plasmid [Rhodovastum atsumiense]|uniref:HAD-IA family hydrolase n=1 Tax=Rhodovastum atsumiense TaxID=504468 RepID=A0A5M6IMA3_9PROT|nr:HAD-IA family hydrolase [Rhodovastum atsumiense]KAA5609077.1 HAD-IA family hydrolase [Rhodovastum atsumiense]CAH2602169.1 Protein CbbY, plasmid [Rhodovastum atsumiense]